MLTVMALLLELALTTALDARSRMPPPPLPPGTDVNVQWRAKPVFLPHPPKPPQ
jgi:hypothetical protein